MAIFKNRTKKDIQAALQAAGAELADRKAKMTAAILANNDTAAEKLATEIARLEAQQTALRNALPKAEEHDTQAAAEKAEKARQECDVYRKRLNDESAVLLRDIYSLADRCEAMVTKHRTMLVTADRAGFNNMWAAEDIALAMTTARVLREPKIRIGLARPEFALASGLEPYKG